MDAEEREKVARLTRGRITILRAVDAALTRYREVSEAVANSADRRAAISAIGQLLGVDETPARAVVELQWGRLSHDARAAVAEELEQLVRELEMLQG